MKKKLWTAALAATGLLSLLITHQLVWLQITNLTGQTLSPLVFLSPADPKLASEQHLWPPPRPMQFEEYRVHEPSLDLAGFGPSKREITISRNGVLVTKLPTLYGQIRFPPITLRDGPNEVLAVAQETAPDATLSPAHLAGLKVVYEPKDRVTPVLIGAYRGPSGVMVRGLARPYGTLFERTGGKETKLYTDWVGAFQISAPPAKSLTMVAASPEDFGTNRAVTIPADIKIESGPSHMEPDPPDEQFTRRVRMKLDGDHFDLHMYARVPAETPLWRWANDQLISGPELSRGLFGVCLPLNVPMNEYALRTQLQSRVLSLWSFLMWCHEAPGWMGLVPGTESPAFEISANQTGIELRVQGKLPAEGLRLELHGFSGLIEPPLAMASEEVRIDASVPEVVRTNVPPTRVGKGVFVWRNAALPNHPGSEIVLAELKPPAAAAAAPSSNSQQVEPKAAPQKTIIDLVHAIEDKVPEKLKRIFVAVLSAVPFIGFLLILRKCTGAIPRGFEATLHAGTVTLLLLHLTIFAMSVFSVSLGIAGFALTQTGLSSATIGLLATIQRLGNIYPFLGIGVVLLLRPIYRAARCENLRPQVFVPRWKWLQWTVYLALAVTAPLAAIWATVTVGMTNIFRGTAVSAAQVAVTGVLLAAGLLVLWYPLYWLIRGILGFPVKVRSTISASWGMLLLPVIPAVADASMGFVRRAMVSEWKIYPFFLPEGIANAIWFGIVSILGAALIYEVALIGVRLSQKRAAYRWFRSRKRWLIRGGLILISMPVTYLLGSPGGNLDISRFTALAYSVDDLLPYALLPGIILLLHKQNRGDSFVLSAGSIAAGALLFSFYLTGRTANLLFIPIPLLMGYYLFKDWSLTAQPAPPLTVTKEIVSRFVKYKESTSRAESLEGALEKKLGSGDLSLEDFRKKTGESRRAEKDAAAMLHIAAGTTSPEIFAYGPEDGPWKNALVAVRYALVISLPFQAITLMNLLKPREATGFPFIDVLKALLFSTSTWLLTAFLFGYFFHLIRGRSGFQKALVYSAALVLPTIPMRLIAAQPLGGAGHLLEIGELAGFTLILALVAFDYKNLQKYGKSWRDLLTIYGWTGVAAYGSTILLALGSSFATKLLPELLNLFKKGGS
jgi:hypothetical protein